MLVIAMFIIAMLVELTGSMQVAFEITPRPGVNAADSRSSGSGSYGASRGDGCTIAGSAATAAFRESILPVFSDISPVAEIRAL
jgi:hypothetical protein